ncbi:hypothetical protein SAMN05216357_11089, partial [Porphyromonadaceae bacterium KH3CP3RA]
TKKVIGMKKIKLSSLQSKTQAAISDRIIISEQSNTQRIRADDFIRSMGVSNGYYFEKSLANGEEVSIGHSGIGIYIINTIGNGISAVFIIGAFVDQWVKIAESRFMEEYFVYGEKANKYCIYRKTTSGDIFIKNNTGSTRAVRIQAITTPVA